MKKKEVENAILSHSIVLDAKVVHEVAISFAITKLQTFKWRDIATSLIEGENTHSFDFEVIRVESIAQAIRQTLGVKGDIDWDYDGNENIVVKVKV